MCELFCVCLQHIWSCLGSSTKRLRVVWIFNYLRISITPIGEAGLLDYLDNFGESETPADTVQKFAEEAQHEVEASSEVKPIVSQCDEIQIV